MEVIKVERTVLNPNIFYWEFFKMIWHVHYLTNEFHF
jgi:hypothetical protein